MHCQILSHTSMWFNATKAYFKNNLLETFQDWKLHCKAIPAFLASTFEKGTAKEMSRVTQKM